MMNPPAPLSAAPLSVQEHSAGVPAYTDSDGSSQSDSTDSAHSVVHLSASEYHQALNVTQRTNTDVFGLQTIPDVLHLPYWDTTAYQWALDALRVAQWTRHPMLIWPRRSHTRRAAPRQHFHFFISMLPQLMSFEGLEITIDTLLYDICGIPRDACRIIQLEDGHKGTKRVTYKVVMTVETTPGIAYHILFSLHHALAYDNEGLCIATTATAAVAMKQRMEEVSSSSLHCKDHPSGGNCPECYRTRHVALQGLPTSPLVVELCTQKHGRKFCKEFAEKAATTYSNKVPFSGSWCASPPPRRHKAA